MRQNFGTFAVGLVALLLPACSLFDDTDPREGPETLEACAARVAADAPGITAQDGAMFTPTYTYDITKVSLEDIQALTVAGADETAGSRGMAATNETSTAVARFMAQSVDEKGAFFMGRDPALYRVRGAPVAIDQIVTAGCERQKVGMRLISYTAVPASSQPEQEPEAEEGTE
jgi:hypothetical protein